MVCNSINLFTNLLIIIKLLNRFKSSSIGWWPRIFDFSNGVSIDSIYAVVNWSNTNKLSCTVRPPNTNTLDYDLVVNDNTWRHLVWTISSDGTWKIYMNGQLYRTDNSMPVPSYKRRVNAYLGRSEWPQSSDSPYNGYMDDFRVYNTVLNANDVTALYNYNGSASLGNITYIKIYFL